MDLTVFNNYREQAQQQGEQKFNEPLDTARHRDPDLHLIGDDLPTPTTVVTAGSVAVGISPRAAREDHYHGAPDEFDPSVKNRYALEDGSSLSPSLYWPDSGGIGNLGIYRVALNNSFSFGANGNEYMNLDANGITLIDSVIDIDGNIDVNSGIGYSGTIRAESNIQADNTDTNLQVHIGQGIGNYTTWGVVQGKNGSVLLGNSSNNAVYFRNRSSNTLYLGTRNTNDAWIQGTDGVFVFDRSPSIGNILTTSGFNTLRYDTNFGLVRHFTSSIEIKENVDSIPEEVSGDVIDNLRPVSFVEKYQGEGEEPAESKEYREKDIRYGLIAEEVWEVADGHLSTVETKDGELKPRAWDEGGMMAMALAELKFLRKRVAKLEQLTDL